MTNKKAKVKNPSGLQLDAAGGLCALAMDFDCKVHFKYRGDNEANAKSVLSILGAGIRAGEELEIICEGSDEAQALTAIVDYIEGKG